MEKGARKLLAEEKQREEEEEASRKEKRKKEEAIQGNIFELEKAIAQEDLNPEQEVQDQERLTEEQTKEIQDDVSGEDQGWSPIQNDPEDLPSNSKNMLTRGNLLQLSWSWCHSPHQSIMRLDAQKMYSSIPKRSKSCGEQRRL